MKSLRIYGVTLIMLFALGIVLLFFTKPYAHQVVSLFQYSPPPPPPPQTMVIGDKKGTATSVLLIKPNNFKVLDDIQRTLKTKLKFIHVIRNPFDNIATKLLRNLETREMARDKSFKANNSTLLDEIITHYFNHVESAQRLHQYGKYEVLDIYAHEVISKPQENLQKLCNFLEVTNDKDYIDASSKLLYSKPSLTRHSIVWTSEQKLRVTNEMKKYPFMRPYSFDKNY
ncbi:hypothetical protein OS493_024340 [Desmophyllum pertusum]|uniref:Protein-tyrosine sulfotransferase n=1 Tax=Desmophyllum pertusum TaxID=174260 RepID=A0A9W9YLK8_9CNID|nr:hypothetical protein OS493_024340 [Desmophyllum pertusum]